VRSGMPISRAYKLCPEAVYLPPNFPLYIRVSGEIMAIARQYADKFEQWGIDEAFLDVSKRVRDYTDAENLAGRLKFEIREKEKLTCSIGIGPNKLVAKKMRLRVFFRPCQCASYFGWATKLRNGSMPWELAR
jgi:DNA polymerase IV (DinB-like DNA polymerase)